MNEPVQLVWLRTDREASNHIAGSYGSADRLARTIRSLSAAVLDDCIQADTWSRSHVWKQLRRHLPKLARYLPGRLFIAGPAASIHRDQWTALGIEKNHMPEAPVSPARTVSARAQSCQPIARQPAWLLSAAADPETPRTRFG